MYSVNLQNIGGLEMNCYRAGARVHWNIGIMMDVINGCDRDRYISKFIKLGVNIPCKQGAHPNPPCRTPIPQESDLRQYEVQARFGSAMCEASLLKV